MSRVFFGPKRGAKPRKAADFGIFSVNSVNTDTRPPENDYNIRRPKGEVRRTKGEVTATATTDGIWPLIYADSR
jgi:hypothetical protein